MADAANPVDSRDIITQDAFRVEPELLGRPLAKPWRRACAMGLDVVLVGILSNTAAIFFGIAAAYVLFRISRASAKTGYIRSSVRLLFRLSAALVLFIVILSVGDRVSEWGGADEEEVATNTPGELTMGGMEGLATAAEIVAFRQSDTEAEALERASSLVDRLRGAGVPPDEIDDFFEEIAEDTGRPWLTVAADSAMGESQPDTLATTEADSLSLLASEIDQLEREKQALATALAAAQEEPEATGILDWLGALAEDLGLGLGWSGLYFTAFLALGRGRTPGKAVMRIRVIRLDGLPIGWWAAFERFGGYAASIATGLLGFFQIVWDRNRQGIHDKIAFTVVVDD